ncbi:M3 family oligoendopeptidase [Clostridium novyi]|uniref:Oligoendopeptidase F n=1 Tax=Clostridium novyi (strain NT) TaxID=386415 RepID=A0PY71_CLONN|nr:M3 family oligoendopeptidase [Clostridium novyi]ABK60994.1 oligoendopeptidase F [Clostridium novyi NT]
MVIYKYNKKGGNYLITFSEYEYVRPNIDEVKDKFNELISRFQKANSFDEQDSILEEIKLIRNEVESMMELVYIRNSINTVDEFYEKEKEFMDEVSPIYQGLISDYYKVLINSKFRSKLEEKWGKQLFKLAEMQIKTFSPDIIEDLQVENKLVTEYDKLKASAKIMFEGKERNLSELEPFMQSQDRSMRKKTYEAYSNFFKENEAKFDEIYDKLVKVRHKIAKKLGYKNFVEVGYMRMQRSDYNAEMVSTYREQVLKYIVPVAEKLKKRQAERLGLKELKYYDEPIKFLTGNAVPKGDYKHILNNAKTMYKELSEETNKFFNFMVDHELMDLLSKKGKAGGGYCTYISKYKSPFIFSNFNGTSGDIDVLTHEAGHAFQTYLSRSLEIPEYAFPTSEAAEIHSMSMEFLTWPWMNLFFEEQEQKYKFAHLSEAITFIPYGVTVDEFQHFVYENPEVTPEERKLAWRKIEKKYLPGKDYEDNDFYNRGGFWFKQGHIFQVPFYYIDYTLAQVCAFQFWIKSHENRENAWKDYLALCKEGGSKPFLELLKVANLKNPFEDGCMKKVVEPLEEWLDNNNIQE